MQSHLEVESKLELSRPDFDYLLGKGRIKKVAEQLNVYYDFKWLLASVSATFRIRLVSGSPAMATLKIPVQSHDGQRISREIETPARQAIASPYQSLSVPRHLDVRSHLAPHFRDALLGLDVLLLSRVGHMRTTRHVVEFAGGGTVELDWVKLPGGQDFFEAEVENDNMEEQRHLVDVVRRLAPGSRPSTLSKFERFQRALERSRRVCRWDDWSGLSLT
jgi:uncharacterized protein YjbK